MKKRQAMLSALSVLTFSALIAGASSGAMANAKIVKQHRVVSSQSSITIALPSAFGPNLIPQLDSSLYTAQITNYQFDPLLNVNPNDQLIGDIVDKWVYSKDKKTIYFSINPKARWSNGRYVTSKDVELGVDWLASKSYTADQGEYASEVNSIVGATKPIPDGTTPSGFKLINAREFSITMYHVDATNLAANLQFIQPLPYFALGKLPMSQWKTSAFNKLPNVGDGPYIVTNVVPGQSVTMTANPYYLHGEPLIATTIYKVVSQDTVAGDLVSGQVNMSGIHPKDVAKLKTVPSLSINVSPTNGYSFLGWRMNNTVYGKEFSNVLFRQAVEYAINRQAIIQAIDKGFGKPENGPLPPVNFWYNMALNNTYPFSTAKANQLLDQAGFKMKNGWRTTPGGRTFTPTLTISSGDTAVQIEANFIQQFLKAVHIDVKVLPAINFNTMLNQLNNDANGKQPIQGFFMAWSLGTGPQDPRPLWLSNAAFNTTAQDWQTPKSVLAQNDKLLNEQANAAAYRDSYRKSVLDKWQVLMNQQMPTNFLTMDDTLTAYSSNLHGVVFTDLGTFYPWKWYFTNKKVN